MVRRSRRASGRRTKRHSRHSMKSRRVRRMRHTRARGRRGGVLTRSSSSSNYGNVNAPAYPGAGFGNHPSQWTQQQNDDYRNQVYDEYSRGLGA